MTKLKFSAFGKVKLKPQVLDKKLRKLLDKKNIDVEEDVNERLLEIQREAFKKEIEEVLMIKKTKGKCAEDLWE